jgi:4-aminobutyrate aminotransferase-like enzyme
MAVIGKPMGNGFPIGGVICRLELAESIDDLNLFSTFGGSPPAAAAGESTCCFDECWFVVHGHLGLAVLNAVKDDNLCERSQRLGAYMQAGLNKLQQQHPQQLSHVTGRGLFLGMKLFVPSPLVCVPVPHPWLQDYI